MSFVEGLRYKRLSWQVVTQVVSRSTGTVATPRRAKGKPEELVLGPGPRVRDFYDRPDGELLHLTNWIDCVRNRPVCLIETGVSAAAAAHLGNQAYRTNQVVRWQN